MPAALAALTKRWFHQRHFFAFVCIPLFFVFIMLFGGLRNLLIGLHQARTIATVTKTRPYSHSHPSIYYRYEVDGQAYTGTGGPDHPSFTPPLSVGDTFEIRYCRFLPSFSTAQNPFTIFGQFLVGCLILLLADFMATRCAKRRESNG